MPAASCVPTRPTTARTAMIALGLLALVTPAASRAQSSARWTGPTVVSTAKTAWTRPTIVADASGGVHVLWADRTVPPLSGKDAKGDGLYHAVWDGQQWSPPVRVLAKDRRAFCLVYPDATVGSDNQLYVVWSDQSALHFSRAAATVAHDPRSWVEARRIVQATMVDQSRIIRDAGGRLHVVYTRLASDNGPAGNLFYVFSADGGNVWSTPVQLSRVPVQDPHVAAVPRLVLDRAGALHVAWEEPGPPSWLGDRVLYARSDDGGRTWTEPTVLSSLAVSPDRNCIPSLASTGHNAVHLTWACGAPPTRCYRTSNDGGKMWSPTLRVFPDFVSVAGWDDLVADANGNLHLVAQLRMPYGIYHAALPAQGSWQPPLRFVGEPGFEDGHFVSAVAVRTDVWAAWQKGAGSGDVTVAHMTLAPDTAAHPAPLETPRDTAP